MNRLNKTYGIVINLDYTHLPKNQIRQMWNKISRVMQLYGFHIDKRMFIIHTEKNAEFISTLARTAIDSIDSHSKFQKNSPYHYITDFFAVEMSNYIDLRLPALSNSIELTEIYNEENKNYA